MCECAKSCPVLFDPIVCKLSRLLWLWDFPCKNTGVGFHFFSKGSSWPMDRNRQVLYHWATRDAPPFKHFARTSERESVLKKNVSIWYEICMDMSEWMAHILANIIIIINCYLLCEKEMQLKYTCFEVTNSLFMLLPFA